MRLIDADAFIEELEADAEHIESSIARMMHYAIIKDIEHAPTIDAVEVVHGEWIHDPQIGWGETWVCSICGEKTTSSLMGEPRYEYCPMCGARMKGEQR